MKTINYRYLENQLTNQASKNKIKLLFGARQTGKSTLLKKLINDKAVFINLQDRNERVLFERNRNELKQRLKAIKDPTMVVIDEIQKVPELLDDVQFLYDEEPEKYDFYLSGSSARKLQTASANLVPGRAHQFKIFPIMLSEMAGKLMSVILNLPDLESVENKFILPSIEELLIFGSLPGVLLEAEVSKGKTLEAYTELYIEDEIRKEALIKNIGYFTHFLELSALESGNIMNLAGLSQQSGIPVSTIKTYYQTLVDTFIGFWLPPFITQSRKRILKTAKFYFFDCGVRNALAQLSFNPQLIKFDSGRLFEQWVINELYNRCYYLGKSYKLFYWQTESGVEVDLVITTPEETIPIEIKWTEAPTKRDIKGLEIFLNDYSKIAKKGYLICRTKHRLQLSDRVTAIPWNEF